MMSNLDLLWQAWQPLIAGAVTLGVAFAVLAAFTRIGWQYGGWIILAGIAIYLFS